MRLVSGDSSSWLAAVVTPVGVASTSGNMNHLGVTNSTSMSDSSCPLPRPKFPPTGRRLSKELDSVWLMYNEQLLDIAW